MRKLTIGGGLAQLKALFPQDHSFILPGSLAIPLTRYRISSSDSSYVLVRVASSQPLMWQIL